MDQLFEKVLVLAEIYGGRMIAAAAILLIGRIIAGIIKGFLAKLMRKSKVDEMLISFVSSVTYVGLMLFIVVAALGKLGIQTTSFVAIIGAAGLAIGLALQGSLANFASGFLMIIFKPFKVGDFIEAAGTMGTVEEITIFTTQMKSPDNKRIIVPNSKLTADNIINFSSKETRRLNIEVQVSYKESLEKVRAVLEAILAEEERILAEPAAMIAVMSLGEHGVNLVVRPWTKNSDFWSVFFDLQEKIKNRFDAEGITIPFPQQDVHLYRAE